MGDTLSSKKLVGVISLLSGLLKILSLRPMLLLKSKNQPLIIWRLPMMRLKSSKELPENARRRNGLIPSRISINQKIRSISPRMIVRLFSY